MYKKDIYIVKSNKKIANLVYEMILEGDTQYITKPGQFINLEIDGTFLRRPISICDYNENNIKIIYKVVGEGTEILSKYKEGKKLDILTGLGNGFNINKGEKEPLLIGGGVGTPPMYNLYKRLLNQEKKPIVVLGFNSKDDIFYEEEFKELGADIHITTVDGSYGTKGFVTDIIKQLKGYDYYYACGPLPMLKAIYNMVDADGQLSLEERMGCGFGACMGCSCKTKSGNKRICLEGPVFEKGDIIW